MIDSVAPLRWSSTDWCDKTAYRCKIRWVNLLERTEFWHTRHKKIIMRIIVRQKQTVQTTQGTQLNTRQQEHFGQSAVITNASINERRSTDKQDSYRATATINQTASNDHAHMNRNHHNWMLMRVARLSTSVGTRHPVTVHKASLTTGWMRWV